MTLATSPTTTQQTLPDLCFDFQSNELTGQIRKHSAQNLTGYWTINFEPAEGYQATQWYLCILEGKVLYSGITLPECRDFIEIMYRCSGLRKGEIGKHLKALRSRTPEEQSKQFKQTIRYLIVANLVKAEDIEEAFKIYLINDFDRYLVHPGKGQAQFTETKDFQSFAPIHGFEPDTLFIESTVRRVEWTALKPDIPSLESVLTLPDSTQKGASLPQSQWQMLKGFIQDGKTIIEIAQGMGKDGLRVAKSFQNLLQQKLIVVDAGDRDDGSIQGRAERVPEVFIVDDSPLLIRQFRNLLEHWGYIVHDSDDSATAVDKMLKIKPDMVFIDVNMPAVSGFDLIKQIRRQDKLSSLPLVILTAEKSVSNQWRAQWASCKFLTKPRSPDDVSEFRVALKEILRTFVPLASDVLM